MGSVPRGIKGSGPVTIDEVQLQRESLLLQALRDVLPSQRLYSDDMLRRKIGGEKVADLSLELAAFMEAGAGQLDRNQQVALACQLLRCLSKYVSTEMKLSVTLKTLVDCFGLLEAAVDLCFPGYFVNGLLKHTVVPLRPVRVA